MNNNNNTGSNKTGNKSSSLKNLCYKGLTNAFKANEITEDECNRVMNALKEINEITGSTMFIVLEKVIGTLFGPRSKSIYGKVKLQVDKIILGLKKTHMKPHGGSGMTPEQQHNLQQQQQILINIQQQQNLLSGQRLTPQEPYHHQQHLQQRAHSTPSPMQHPNYLHPNNSANMMQQPVVSMQSYGTSIASSMPRGSHMNTNNGVLTLNAQQQPQVTMIHNNTNHNKTMTEAEIMTAREKPKAKKQKKDSSVSLTNAMVPPSFLNQQESMIKQQQLENEIKAMTEIIPAAEKERITSGSSSLLVADSFISTEAVHSKNDLRQTIGNGSNNSAQQRDESHTWESSNIVDNQFIGKLIGYVNLKNKNMEIDKQAQCVLSTGIQQHVKQILEGVIETTKIRSDYLSRDVYSMLNSLIVHHGKGEVVEANRSNIALKWAPDVHQLLEIEETTARIAVSNYNTIMEQKLYNEMKIYDEENSDVINKGMKRKSSAISNDDTTQQQTWWMKDEKTEQEGVTNWEGIAEIHLKNTVAYRHNCGVHAKKKMGIPPTEPTFEPPIESLPIAIDASDDILKQTCPLLPAKMSEDRTSYKAMQQKNNNNSKKCSNIIIAEDVANAISHTGWVQSNYGTRKHSSKPKAITAYRLGVNN